MKKLFRLPLLPFEILMAITLCILIVYNTGLTEIALSNKEDFSKSCADKYKELYMDDWNKIRDVIAVIMWILIAAYFL